MDFAGWMGRSKAGDNTKRTSCKGEWRGALFGRDDDEAGTEGPTAPFCGVQPQPPAQPKKVITYSRAYTLLSWASLMKRGAVSAKLAFISDRLLLLQSVITRVATMPTGVAAACVEYKVVGVGLVRGWPEWPVWGQACGFAGVDRTLTGRQQPVLHAPLRNQHGLPNAQPATHPP